MLFDFLEENRPTNEEEEKQDKEQQQQQEKKKKTNQKSCKDFRFNVWSVD
jgi:hypothetical protein